jgi:Bacterial Ig-like domain/NHL repeat
MPARARTTLVLAALVAAVAVVPARASTGGFERAFGKDVVATGGTGFEICTQSAICQSGGFGGLGGEMNLPFGVATDSSGNLYVADTDNNRIQKFNSAGTWERAWGKNVNGGGAFGVCTAAASCQAGTTGGLGGEMNSPTGVAVAGGYVYVADRLNHRIQKFDSSGNFVLAWGKNVNIFGGTGFEACSGAVCRAGQIGGLGGEMNVPYSVATDAVANVYVADSGNNRIQKFNSAGTWQRAWGKNLNGGGAFGVCTVASSCLAGTTGELGGEMNSPKGIATDANANVYIADESNHRIQKFDSFGSWNRAWGRDGTTFNFTICTVAANCTAVNGVRGGEMSSPDGVTTDSDANVYVADTDNHRIQKFNSAGTWYRAWGKNANGSPGDFGVCTVASFCEVGTGGLGGEMNLPTSAASDSSGKLYVVDYGNHRIQVFGDVENVKPTVTINQAAGQTDPTNASPITFTVSFSETVTGFTGADVSFTGSTVGGTLAAAVSGSGANYTVSVSGMSGNGTVAASIPAGKAADLAGNPNLASTSSDNTVGFTSQDQGSSTGGSTGTTGTTGTGLQSTENPLCQVLRKKLKKAKTKPAKTKIRRKLRRLSCQRSEPI